MAEDGRGESIWDRFCQIPVATRSGDTGGRACNYSRRRRENVQLMAALAAETYRFSIAWTRVQPAGHGAFYRHGIELLPTPCVVG